MGGQSERELFFVTLVEWRVNLRGSCSLSLSTDSAEECRPELVLKGHTKEGYESWSSLTLSLEFCHFSFMFYFESCNTCFLNWTDRYGLSWNSSVQGHLLSASDDQVRLHYITSYWDLHSAAVHVMSY